jgi:hypothetical protein
MNKEAVPRPLRGDVVEYHGKHYFYQPLGTSCRLYKTPAEIGIKDRAQYSPNSKSVSFVMRGDLVTKQDEDKIASGKPIVLHRTALELLKEEKASLSRLDSNEKDENEVEALRKQIENLYLIVDYLQARVNK